VQARHRLDYTRNEDGSFTWTTDTGHRYTSAATIQWSARSAEPKPPNPPPPATLEQVHAEEDAAYQRLVAKWQHEIDQATEDGDTERQATAQQAFARAEGQRQRQLTCRADPDHPPF
jgi:hypothetical protein